MFTVEKHHAKYYTVRDGSFDILYVNIVNGEIIVQTEEQGVTLQQVLLALAAFTAYLEVK